MESPIVHICVVLLSDINTSGYSGHLSHHSVVHTIAKYGIVIYQPRQDVGFYWLLFSCELVIRRLFWSEAYFYKWCEYKGCRKMRTEHKHTILAVIIIWKFFWKQHNFNFYYHFFFIRSGHDDWRLHLINSFNIDCTSQKRWCYFSFKWGKFSFTFNFCNNNILRSVGAVVSCDLRVYLHTENILSFIHYALCTATLNICINYSSFIYSRVRRVCVPSGLHLV